MNSFDAHFISLSLSDNGWSWRAIQPARRQDSLEPDVLQPGTVQPFPHGFDGGSVAGREGRLQQDPDICRLLLHLPIFLCAF